MSKLETITGSECNKADFNYLQHLCTRKQLKEDV